MIKFLGIALLLAIWHSILFFDNNLGISVILFILPLLCFVILVLKKGKKLKNKYGLLLVIPIILLSSIYFIYDNFIFRILNLLVIPLLFFLMYILTMKSKYSFLGLIKDIFSFLIEPFTYITNISNIIKDNLLKNIKMSDNVKNKLKSIIIILPIIFIVLWLLISADMVFEKIFDNSFELIGTFINNCLSNNLISRIVIILIIFFIISGTIYFLINDYLDESKLAEEYLKEESNSPNIDPIKMLFIILNIIYVVFDIIQIKSLMFHSVSQGIHYAEYARQGFFQLMLVSIINLTLILISKKYMLMTNSKQSKFLKIMSLIMIGLTFIIIVSSFLRMNLYEQQYGYTILRLVVYISLITEIILLIPTIVYVIKTDYNVLVIYIAIILCVYVGFNYVNVEKVIAIRNINRYYDKLDIDLDYLLNDSTDNLAVLKDFYKEVEDEEIKMELEEYFEDFEFEESNIFEYNISRDKGRKLLKR